MPILDAFCGGELVDTLVLPQGEGRGGCGVSLHGAPAHGRAAAGHRERSCRVANHRWRDAGGAAALRQVRNDLRRLARYKASGGLGRSWHLAQQTNTIYRDRRGASTPLRACGASGASTYWACCGMRAKWHAQGGRAPERRRRHFARLVLDRSCATRTGVCSSMSEQPQAEAPAPARPRLVSTVDEVGKTDGAF